jgi:hypothetical protein
VEVFRCLHAGKNQTWEITKAGLEMPTSFFCISARIHIHLMVMVIDMRADGGFLDRRLDCDIAGKSSAT